LQILSGLNWSCNILPRSESNFTHSHLDFKKNFPGRSPRTLAYSGEEEKGEGIKESIPLKEAQRKRTWDGRDRDGREKGGGGDQRQGGSCSKVLREDRRP